MGLLILDKFVVRDCGGSFSAFKCNLSKLYHVLSTILMGNNIQMFIDGYTLKCLFEVVKIDLCTFTKLNIKLVQVNCDKQDLCTFWMVVFELKMIKWIGAC